MVLIVPTPSCADGLLLRPTPVGPARLGTSLIVEETDLATTVTILSIRVGEALREL